MRRRDFLAGLAGVTTAWPLTTFAQSRLPLVGVLLTGNPDPEIFMQSFRAALRDIGYLENQNVRIEVRSAGGNSNLLPARAVELVALKPDVIVASLTPAIVAAKSVAGDIPIVMAPAGEPVATGLVASLARPGGNITGVSAATAQLLGKCLELAREVLPAARRIAILANEADPLYRPFVDQAGPGAQQLGMEADLVMLRPETPLPSVMEAIKAKGSEALVIQGSLQSKELFDLAIGHRLPSFSSNRLVVASGALMTYAASNSEVQRGAARYVDRILKGAKAEELPVMQPTTFELIVNMKTAKAIGLTIPLTLLARATEVIE